MEIPLVELANYPRFHEAARSALELARRFFGPRTYIISHHDRGTSTILKVCGEKDVRLVEGMVVPPGGLLARCLLGSRQNGLQVRDVQDAMEVTPDEPFVFRGFAGVPIRLFDQREFGALCVLDCQPIETDPDHLETLRSLAHLLSFAIDLERMARRDRLTGLFNRSVFDDRLRLEIARARRNGACLATIVVSVAAERADTGVVDAWWLARTAERLRSSVRQGDTVARIGEREFGLVVPDMREMSSARRVAQTLLETLHDPFVKGNEAVSVVPSIGVAVLPQDGFDPKVLTTRAEEAMRAAQSAGGAVYRMYGEQPRLRIVTG